MYFFTHLLLIRNVSFHDPARLNLMMIYSFCQRFEWHDFCTQKTNWCTHLCYISSYTQTMCLGRFLFTGQEAGHRRKLLKFFSYETVTFDNRG